MRIYKLTKLGKQAVRNGGGSAEETRILEFVWNNKTATDDQLEVAGERWLVKSLARKGLLKELTSDAA